MNIAVDTVKYIPLAGDGMEYKIEDGIARFTEDVDIFNVDCIPKVQSTFNTFFKLEPSVKSIVWGQFNDVDNRNFIITEPTFISSDDTDFLSCIDPYGNYDYEDYEREFGIQNEPKDLFMGHAYLSSKFEFYRYGINYNNCRAIVNLLSSKKFHTIFNDMLGCNVKVICIRDGFVCKACEYD